MKQKTLKNRRESACQTIYQIISFLVIRFSHLLQFFLSFFSKCTSLRAAADAFACARAWPLSNSIGWHESWRIRYFLHMQLHIHATVKQNITKKKTPLTQKSDTKNTNKQILQLVEAEYFKFSLPTKRHLTGCNPFCVESSSPLPLPLLSGGLFSVTHKNLLFIGISVSFDVRMSGAIKKIFSHTHTVESAIVGNKVRKPFFSKKKTKNNNQQLHQKYKKWLQSNK